jgi:hypothetical protein
MRRPVTPAADRRVHRPFELLIDDLRKPALRTLAGHWLERFSQDGGIPSLRAIDPLSFAGILKDVWIFSAEPDGDFRVRLCGETFTDWYGFNPMHRTFRDICSPEVLPVLTGFARDVIAGPSVVYHRMASVMPDWLDPASFERIGFPLCDDDGGIRHLIGVTSFDARFFNGKGAVRSRLEFSYRYPVPQPTHGRALRSACGWQ